MCILSRLLVFLAILAVLGAKANGSITLRFAISDGAETVQIYNRFAREFERAHPGVIVKVEPVPSSVSFTQKLLAMVAARVQPDVVRLGSGDQVRLASRHALLELDDFIARTPSIRATDYYPFVWKDLHHDGKMFGLPVSVAPPAIVYYNRRLFHQAGLAEPDGDWTWDYEPRPKLGSRCFTNIVATLTEHDAGRLKRSALGLGWPQLLFKTLMASRDLRLWNDDANPTKVSATNVEVRKTLEFAANFVRKGWSPSEMELRTANTSAADQFIQGKVPMLLTGPWEIPHLRKTMRDDWDITVAPSFAGEPKRYLGIGNGVAIFAATRHPEVAWELTKWMASDAVQIEFAKEGSTQPAKPSITQLHGAWVPVDPRVPPRNILATDVAAKNVQSHVVPDWFQTLADKADSLAWDTVNGVHSPQAALEKYQTDTTQQLAIIRKKRFASPYPTTIAACIAVAIVFGVLAWVFLPDLRWGRSRQAKAEARSAFRFLMPWLIGLAMLVGPMLYSLMLSFSDADLIQSPHWVGLENFRDALFADDVSTKSLRQTLLYAVMQIPAGIVTALALAILLNQKVRGVPLFRALFYLPSLATGVAVSLIWMRVFNPREGLLNAILYGSDGSGAVGSMLSAGFGTPGKPIDWLNNPISVIPAFVLMGIWGAGGGTVIFLAGLQGISPNYYEASSIDGANAWQRFLRITLPLLSPTIFFSSVTGVIGAMQVFTQAMVMTDGGPDGATNFYALNLYRNGFEQLRMGYASAQAWILFVVLFIFTAVQFRGARRWVYYEGGTS